jgi:DNA-binding XRE family transcriptional regulator
MDEDQNNDLSDGQLGHSVGISRSVVVVAVEEEQSLEQLKLNCHEEQVNCHE